jgi:tetratricopeptide (TPR) repeat protein
MNPGRIPVKLMKKKSSFLILFIAFLTVFPVAAGSAVSLYENGITEQNAENWYDASQYFIEATQANPAYADAWFRLAQCTYQLGQYDLVLQYLDTAERFKKQSSDIKNLRGMAYLSLGRMNDARKLFQEVLKAEPNDIDARFGLAELDLADGRLTGAETWYRQALSRQGTNRKALLCLALISAGLGKNSLAQNYMDQALRYYSGEVEVHYLASCLAGLRGDFSEAERHARAAVEINGSYDKAYAILGSILYSEGKYTDAVDVCDFRIEHDRTLSDAWYLKGIAQSAQGNDTDAIRTWTTGLSVNQTDEVMRAALELAVNKSVPVEDTRRSRWASFHITNAREYARRYDGSGESYEYQRALKIDPLNKEARQAYADMLELNGFHELYLEQLKFMKNINGISDSAMTSAAGTASPSGSPAKKNTADVKTDDVIEGYSSLLEDSLAQKWNIQPFFLDKIRWKISVFYTSSQMQFIHSECNKVTAEMAADLFSGAAVTSVEVQTAPVSGYGEAYRQAHTAGSDYFIILSLDEGVRDLTLNAVMYSGRTGTETVRLSFYGTGNNRYASVLRRFRDSVLTHLPVRGKIISRSDSDVLIDLGRSDLIEKGASFDIVRKGGIITADTGPGLYYQTSDIVGSLVIRQAGEEISEGMLTQQGFYDKVNNGDEVVLLSLPMPQKKTGNGMAGRQNTAAGTAAVVGTTPQANVSGKSLTKGNEVKITAGDLKQKKTPVYLDLIRGVY